MNGRSLGATGVAVVVVLVLCGGLAGALLTGGGPAAAGCDATTGTSGAPPRPAVTLTPPPGGFPRTDRWDAEQVANAAVILSVGAGKGVPPRGWVVALATAMQESSLVNLPGGDRDSIGLFQQRPSQGWGTPTQLQDPRYAAAAFYDRLLTVDGWQAMPLTDAAQAVQRSAFPGAYAKWEDDAIALTRTLVTASAGAVPPGLEQALSNPFCVDDGGDGQFAGEPVPLPAGFTLPPATPLPVITAVGWALAQAGTPYTFGGDCTAPRSGIAARQCDCSSLVQQAYRAAEISIPRTTADQVHTGTPVTNVDQLRPGDLLFIPGSRGTASKPGHVGLYLGQGLLVQAPHTGDVVKISTLASWVGHLAAVRRIAVT